MNTQQREIEGNESDLFLVLDGGGARGIAHLAMWRCLERWIAKPKGDQPELPEEFGPARYRLSGIAGTSAGAIAAAFIAAGASASDVIDQDGRPPLCTPLGLYYLHALFGIRGWRRLKHLRRIIKPSTRLRAAVDRFERDLATGQEPSIPTEHANGNSAAEASSQAELVSPTPHTYSAIASKTADQDRDNDKAKAPEIKPITVDTVQILTIIAIFSPFFFDLLKYLVFLKWSPPYSLLMLMAGCYVSFSCTSRIARHIEAKRTILRRRRYSNTLRALLHPALSLIYGVILAAAASQLIDVLATQAANHFPDLSNVFFHTPRKLRDRFPSLPFEINISELLRSLVSVLAWMATGLALGFTAIRFLRDFIKGGVDTDAVEADLNQALRIILTQASQGWDEENRRHIWRVRENLSDRQREILRNPDHVVSFDDMFEVTNIHLTVVAADTIRNCVCTFSSNTHRSMSVARAVAASLAIPFAFQYVREGGSLLVDGGLVSSIPAWVFRRHRNRDPDCKILAIRIEPDRYDSWIPEFLDYRDAAADAQRTDRSPQPGKAKLTKGKLLWKYPLLSAYWPMQVLANILSTSLYGARALELDASDRLESIPLQPKIGLLDFDADNDEIARECDRLEEDAAEFIESRLWVRQKQFEDICQGILDDLRGIKTQRFEGGGLVRMFWAERDGIADAVRLRRTFNYSRDIHFDDRIVMPFRTSMSALAFETGKCQYGEWRTLKDLRAGRMNRYRAAVRWEQLQWCWAIPIFCTEIDRKNRKPAGVLGIESNVELRQFSDQVGQEARKRAGLWPSPLSEKYRDRKTSAERQALYFKIADRDDSKEIGRMKVWEGRFEQRMLSFIRADRDDRKSTVS